MKTKHRSVYYLMGAVFFLDSIVQVHSCFAHQSIVYLLYAFGLFLAASLCFFFADRQ